MRHTILLLFFLISVPLNSQFRISTNFQWPSFRLPGAWGRLYPGRTPVIGRDVVSLPDGGLLVYAFSGDSFLQEKSYLYKMQSDGKVTWKRDIEIGKHHFLSSPILLKKGGVLFCGTVEEKTNLPPENVLYAVDLQGKKLFEKRLSYPMPVVLDRVTELNDGGYFLTGFVFNKSKRSRFPYCVRTDKNGKVLWRRILENAGEFSGHIVDGNRIVLCGGSGHAGFVAVYDTGGKKVTFREYPQVAGYFSGIIRGGKGTWILSGQKGGYHHISAILAKINDSGKVIRKRELSSGFSSLFFTSMKRFGENAFLAPGFTRTMRNTRRNAVLMKFDFSLKTVRGEIFDENQFWKTDFFGFLCFGDGSCLAVGSAQRFFNEKKQLLVVRFTPNGFSGMDPGLVKREQERKYRLALLKRESGKVSVNLLRMYGVRQKGRFFLVFRFRVKNNYGKDLSLVKSDLNLKFIDKRGFVPLYLYLKRPVPAGSAVIWNKVLEFHLPENSGKAEPFLRYLLRTVPSTVRVEMNPFFYAFVDGKMIDFRNTSRPGVYFSVTQWIRKKERPGMEYMQYRQLVDAVKNRKAAVLKRKVLAGIDRKMILDILKWDLDVKRLRTLLEKGLDPDLVIDGKYLLFHAAAAMNHHDEKVSLLLKYGARIDIVNSRRQTVLYPAGYRDMPPYLVWQLVACGITLDHQDINGDTALHYYIRKRDTAIVLFLLRNGAKYRIKNRNGISARDIALKNGMRRLLRKMP